MWMIILGAGASMASPTTVPGFVQLRDAILAELGWQKGNGEYEHNPVDGRPMPPLTSARLKARSAPPEVVFGTLHRFGVPFAAQVEGNLLKHPPPFNAVHLAAARLLKGGDPVWTTNIDVAVEDACNHLEFGPRRIVIGERDNVGNRTPFRVEDVDGRTFLKLHGSVDRKQSLAFVDLELLAPYEPAEVERMAVLATHRRLVVYGYRGADADLHSLVEATAERAGEVRWYEPSVQGREYIERSFPTSPIAFDPSELPGSDFVENLTATAQSFVDEAVREELLDPLRDAALWSSLGQIEDLRPFTFDFAGVPAIVNARIVERFGKAEDVERALRVARHSDLVRVPPRAVGDHLHWRISQSLYDKAGIVHRMVGAAANHPEAAAHLPARLRRYVFDKGPAVLLPEGRFREIHSLVQRAARLPERTTSLQRGSDRYYQAHSLRYLDRPGESRDVLDEAAGLLRGDRKTADAERYAGVILEQGEIALYQGRIHDAFAAANDLVNGAGRYAIGRWSGWGHWLWAMAHLYSAGLVGTSRSALDEADQHITLAREDFEDADLTRGLVDVEIAQSLMRRLQFALGDGWVLGDSERLGDGVVTKRQSQDLMLLRADTAIGLGDLDVAVQCLDEVEQSPSSELTSSWARLGRAELALHGQGPGPSMADLREDALRRGAWWLAAQAELGMGQSEDVVTPAGVVVRAVGRPRVLWMTT